MKKISMAFAFLFCVAGTVFVQDSDAGFYKYVDKNGTICFADDLQVVPKQYRASAVIVESAEEDDDARTTGATGGKVEVETAQSPAQAKAEFSRPLSTRLMISGAIGLGVFLIFILISMLPELKENKKALSIIRAALTASVLLYFIVAHAGDVITVFGAAGKAVENVQNRSAEKGKKAGQAIKQLDTLFEEAQKAQKLQEAPAGGAELEENDK